MRAGVLERGGPCPRGCSAFERGGPHSRGGVEPSSGADPARGGGVTPSFKGKTECIDHVCQDQVTHTLRHYEYQNRCHTDKELLQTIVLNES
jgi:hypothetical protein